ncbi:hypothetical protein BV25DRAFT_1338414 [Artomyces pyxidatus]|uniref:Uncharacterized protein n=1 Tax=Artomyces pyxidatus TaxID=48021 RepID=A0ACB8SPZ5_9AGAM|nr:hypothetical protein BV25DRAFT_1338414 [Artomyces pyxidatus]
MTYWMKREDYEWLLRAFPGQIVESREENTRKELGDIQVEMWEWLLLPLLMLTKEAPIHPWPTFDLRSMRFTDFMDTILNCRADDHRLHLISVAQLVIGGVDFTNDFSKPEYLLPNKAARVRYLEVMDVLAKTTVFWPDHRETLRYGGKVALIRILDIVAHYATRSARPVTIALRRGTIVPEDVVIKRGHSGYSEHVDFPKEHSGKQRPSELFVEDDQFEFNSAWFYQPYLSHLRNTGEFRAYFAGGKYCHTTRTLPMEGSEEIWVEELTGVIPLRVVRCISSKAAAVSDA